MGWRRGGGDAINIETSIPDDFFLGGGGGSNLDFRGKGEIQILGEGGSSMQIWKDLKYGFQEKQGREGGVRQSGKFPDYFGFFPLKASPSKIAHERGKGFCLQAHLPRESI